MTKTTPPVESICQALDLVDGKAGIGKDLFETISSLTPAISVELTEIYFTITPEAPQAVTARAAPTKAILESSTSFDFADLFMSLVQ